MKNKKFFKGHSTKNNNNNPTQHTDDVKLMTYRRQSDVSGDKSFIKHYSTSSKNDDDNIFNSGILHPYGKVRCIWDTFVKSFIPSLTHEKRVLKIF